MKEQLKEVKKDMEKRLKAAAEHMRNMASKPSTIVEEEEGEASRAAADRLARWVSQIPPSENPAILPSPRKPSLPPPPLPKVRDSQAPLSSSSSSSSSSSKGGRHQRGWTKGSKGRKGEKFFLKGSLCEGTSISTKCN
jgi:hypothetical protein